MAADGLRHGVRVVHLHADHLDLGAHCLDVVGHTRNQPAAADGHKHRIQLVVAQSLQLAQHFHGDRALARDHVRIVEGVHKGQALFGLQLGSVFVGVRVALAAQHHLAAQGFHCIHFQLRRRGWHHNHGSRAQSGCAHRNALRVVAGRRTDHATRQLLRCELGHLVVGAAQLEAEHGLLVFALEQHLVVQASAEGFRDLQIGLDGDVVDACGQDLLQVIKRGERLRLLWLVGHGRSSALSDGSAWAAIIGTSGSVRERKTGLSRSKKAKMDKKMAPSRKTRGQIHPLRRWRRQLAR
ncbi:hypothetical protein SDC9_124320 [bioreactor metagenome]|uniref:Uncharacterized protein n=1 Tax=bioreactor metagenome TaxID=1076179 RepID=A0A645CK36_9ZZZZ